MADLPPDLKSLVTARDGAERLVSRLESKSWTLEVVASEEPLFPWETCGLYYLYYGQPHQAIQIFEALYQSLLRFQETSGQRIHKGLPLVWISDAHDELDHPILAKRYLMLTACEDSIRASGAIPAEGSGVYPRMVWQMGLPSAELARYAAEVWDIAKRSPRESRFPEWVLQELDNEWIVEYPSAKEAGLYSVSRVYSKWLLDRLGEGDGLALERLAEYLLSCIPGCRTYRRQRSDSTDYDVVCAVEGSGLDFRSDLGRYFVCECKDWDRAADFTVFAKFCRVLDSTKCKFGILFSKKGISGSGRRFAADLEQIKFFQDRGTVIAAVSLDDLQRVVGGASFMSLLRGKYEAVRLNLVRPD